MVLVVQKFILKETFRFSVPKTSSAMVHVASLAVLGESIAISFWWLNSCVWG